MTTPNPDELKVRIQELEAEVREREKDVAKYRDELAKANGRLETLIAQIHQEIKLAHATQKALVPTEFPHVPGFEFSTKFVASMIRGGDYFDIFSHDDRLRFGVVLAGGSGHSMSALFLSVLLRFTGQMEARKGAEPHNIMKQMAAELVPNMEEGSRADIFYGLVDRRSYELSYCRLGEVVALHQAFADGELKLLESNAGPICPGFAEEFQSKTLALNPRDKLILCSPGVLEGQSLQGEPFGLPRLSRSIVEGGKRGVHEIRNQILYDVQKFTSGQEPLRDMTVVVVEVKDKVIKLAKN
ncbi:MAG: PP2C family protein-serine/threonine phosphatase [Bdellovibrionales bacterium]